MRRWLIPPAALALVAASWAALAHNPSAEVPDRNPAGIDRVSAQQRLTELSDAVRSDSTIAAGALSTTVAENAAALRVDDLGLNYLGDTGVTRQDGSWDALVDLDYRLPGEEAVEVEASATFDRRDGAVDLVSLSGPQVPLWMTGPVSVLVGDGVVVVTDAGPSQAHRIREMAQRGVRQVERVEGPTEGRVVLELAIDVALTDVLDAPLGSYDAVAAVTATADGSNSPRAPTRVHLNPVVFGELTPLGQQVVITHEITHALTGVVTGSMPLWLVEGYADYVALSDTGLPLRRTAGRILSIVEESGPPAALPSAQDFDSGSADFGAQYQAAWLACTLIADLGGPAALVDLYDEVSAGTPLDSALQKVVGLGTQTFTERWRTRLQQLADTVLTQSHRGS